MDNNFAELTSNTVQKSSELSNFPITNVQNRFRSKVFKFSGRFEITASNQNIYINDGSPKTAVVTIQNYATPALLATEMTTQLNAVSSGWTVTYDSVGGTYKFTISHGSGHTIVFSNSTNAIWDTIGFTGSTDLAAPQTADEQRNHTSEFITFDFNGPVPIEFFAMIGPLDEEVSFSDQATVRLQLSNIDYWGSSPIDITLTKNSQGYMRFLDDIANSTYRFAHISIEDKLNPLGPEGLKVGHIYLGDYTTFTTNNNIATGFKFEINDPSRVDSSENGALYFDRVPKYYKFGSTSINFLAKAEKELIEQMFYDFGLTTPLYVSIDPRTEITQSIDVFTKYVVFDSVPSFTHIIRDLFMADFSFREMV